MNSFDESSALWKPRPSGRFVVGADVDATVGPRAHAVVDVGLLTARHGVALCGLPVQELVIVPDLDWSQVEASSRCGHCQEAFPRDT